MTPPPPLDSPEIPISPSPPTDTSDSSWSAWTSSPDPVCDLPPFKRPAPSPLSHPPPQIRLHVASPAGKPIFHFSHPPSALTPTTHLPTLSSVSVAFSSVAPTVRTIRSPSGTIFLAATHSLHLTTTADDPHFPTAVLASLARLSVAFLSASLSANLTRTLRDLPGFDAAPHAAAARPRLTALLRTALRHPLPFACLAPALLPCPTRPASRADVGRILTAAMRKAQGGCVTHAMVVTASAPMPRKVVAVAEPADAPLTPLDVTVLTSLVPGLVPRRRERCGSSEEGDGVDADADASANVEVEVEVDAGPEIHRDMPERVFLQSTAHSVPYALASSPVELRLRSEDYDAFEMAVGGDRDWRPEWDAAGGDVVSVLVLAKPRADVSAQIAAEVCVRDICTELSEAKASRDLIVAMERPLLVSDIPALRDDPSLCSAVKGIVVFSASGDRSVSTLGACDNSLGLSFTRALSVSGWAADGGGVEGGEIRAKRKAVEKQKRNGIWHVVDEGEGLNVFGCQRQVLAAVDCSVSEAEAEDIFVNIILPWEERYRLSLCSEFDRVALPGRTMFGNLLAPFPGS